MANVWHSVARRRRVRGVTLAGQKVRSFVVDGAGVVVVVSHTVSPELDAAYDILDDAGYMREDRLRLIYEAERQGMNPEHFARHLVKLCKAANEPLPS
jgi:hypothetical protein